MDDDCQILDVNIDIGGRVIYTSKLIAEVDPPSLFAEIVTEAIEEYAQSALNLSDIDEDADEEDLNEDDPIKVEAQRLIALIKSIKCTGRDRSAELLKFLQKSSITLKSLHSISSPIFRTGITIKIGKPKAPMASSDPKPKVNPFAIMMGAENAKELRFITPPPQQLTPNLDVQIRTGLYEHLIHIKLGYNNPDQKYVLETNVGKITNALCMIEKHWHKFFYKEFPNISEKCFNYSLIQLTAQCNRNTARKSEKLKIELVISHITALTTLSWTMFSSAKAIKKSLDVFKGDIAKVCSLLTDKKLSMLGHNSILSQKPVTKVFKSLPSYVQLDEGNNEFYVSIPPSTKKHSKQRGQPSAKMTSIRHAIKSIAQSLRHSEDYVVRHITDEEMGIIDEAFLCEGGTVSLTSADRTFYRTSFKTELAKGLDGLCISLFGRSSSIGPSCLFVWKTPMLHGDAHAGNVQLAINECRDILPKKVSAESARHFNNILRGIAKVPAKVRAALTSYLFGGELNVTGDDADTYYEFVENLAGGLPIDDSWIVDGRAFNSRGGKGINSTKFEEFWEVCRSIILPTATTEERRHNGCLHASAVLSIPDLRRQAIESLENKVKQNVLAVMPPVPSIEWVRLQFVPSNDTVNKAAQMSGRLGCKRAAQKRTLRKAHVDQHWVNAMTRYILLWLIELKKATDGVLFLGQDDKAKIPVGDSVPISTGVRANVRRSIVNADTEDSLTAMDHDFHVVNLVCSATLVCNIPDSIGGSFFMLNTPASLNLHAIISIEHEQNSYSILSFCSPIDLLNLAMTSKIFGFQGLVVKSKQRKKKRFKKVNANQRNSTDVNTAPCSLVEDAARSMVLCVTNPAVKDICKRKGNESWLACYHRLHLFRHELVFNRIIGATMGYVKNDPRHVQSRPRSLSCDVFMSSLAMCQEVMTTGVHTVKFCVISKSGCRIKLGVIRPIEDLNTESVKTFDLDAARPLYSDWFYASRENFTTQRL